MNAFKNIASAPDGTRLRAQFDKVSRVDRDANDGAGAIYGLAVVTRGEAQGHGLWMDQQFIESVATAGASAGEKGIKARFTHPGLSSDGLGKALGRMRNFRLSGGAARADLHFAAYAHDTPDGDLADYVMRLAEEAPADAGVSIVFRRDLDAEDAHQAEHAGDTGKFQSPDTANTQNLPHARLAELRAADIVDSPAAAPDGLFSASGDGGAHAVLTQLDTALDQILNDPNSTQNAPIELLGTAIHPARARLYFQDYLRRRGLSLRAADTSEAPGTGPVAVDNEETDMTTKDTNTSATALADTTLHEGPDLKALADEAIAQERARVAAIRQAFTADSEFALKAIDEGLSAEAAKAEYAGVLAERLSASEKRVAELEKQLAEAAKTRPAQNGVPFGEASPDGGDFMSRVAALRQAEGLSSVEAQRRIAREHPELYREYTARPRG